MKNLKYKIMALLGLSLPVVSFAEGEVTTTPMDTTSAQGVVKSATDGLQGLIESVTPYVTALILAGLAIWAALVIIRIVKRAFSRAG